MILKRYTIEGLFDPDQENDEAVCLDHDIIELENFARQLNNSVKSLLDEAVQFQEYLRKTSNEDDELNEKIKDAQELINLFDEYFKNTGNDSNDKKE